MDMKKLLIISIISLTLIVMGGVGVYAVKLTIKELFMWQDRREFCDIMDNMIIPEAQKDSIIFNELQKNANQLFIDVEEMNNKKDWKIEEGFKRANELQNRKDSISNELNMLMKRNRKRDSIVNSHIDDFHNNFNEPIIK